MSNSREHELCGRKVRLEREGALVRPAGEAETERARAREWARLEQEACGPSPKALQYMAELGIRSGFGRVDGSGRVMNEPASAWQEASASEEHSISECSLWAGGRARCQRTIAATLDPMP